MWGGSLGASIESHFFFSIQLRINKISNFTGCTLDAPPRIIAEKIEEISQISSIDVIELHNNKCCFK